MVMVNDPTEQEFRDPLARMRVYQLAKQLRSEVWEDAEVLAANPITEKVSGQLYYAVGSISANIAEGYSRSSGKDRARIFEYALGSARESIQWYESAERTLEPETLTARLKVLTEILRILLAVIPRERLRTIRPK